MINVVKKHSISSELAQKMVNAAVAKATELGVSENVAILDDGGNLKAFNRMDGASMPTIEIALNKAYTALFGVSTVDFFNFIQGDPSLLAGIPTLPRVAGVREGDPRTIDSNLALVRDQGADDDLHEGRLPGPVVADQTDDLAGSNLEVDPLQGRHGAEALRHTSQLDDWRA